MTPENRVEHALRFDPIGPVPFTIYECMVFRCAGERQMRNRGMCVVERVPSAVRTHRPNITQRTETFVKDGRALTRRWLDTPAGTLTEVTQPAGFTVWRHEHFFKSPEDYPALLALIQDEQYEPNYDAVLRARDEFDGDAILRSNIGLEPLQQLISGGYMDPQTFCMEWMDRRDEILKLYDALVEKRRMIYPLIAIAPQLVSNYGGNVSPEIVSPAMFEEYYMPHYAEAAEVLHGKGKLIGVHFDANCGALAELIGRTPLDYIEAFTPAPDTDMTMAQARAAWPDKVLWLNFPSSVHLRDDDAVARAAYELIENAGSPEGIIMGITEDIPRDRWPASCIAVMDGLERHASDRGYLTYVGQ